MTVEKCPVCASPVEPVGRGRPATYCSPACRRSAEYELRRVDRALFAMEKRAADQRIVIGRSGGRPTEADRCELEAIDVEVERLRTRLLALLGANESGAS